MNSSDVQTSVDSVKVHLKRFRQLKERSKALNDSVRQLAIACSLKNELSQCVSDRNPSVCARLKVKPLNENRCIFMLNIANRGDDNLDGWSVSLEIAPISSLFCDFNRASTCYTPNTIITRTISVPLLRQGTSIDLDFFNDDRLYTEYFVQCYLIKQFRYQQRKDEVMDDNSGYKFFRIRLNKFLLTVLDYVQPPNFPTFLSTSDVFCESTCELEIGDSQQKLCDQKLSERLRFRFAYSALRLICGTKAVDSFHAACDCLIKWLMTSLQDKEIGDFCSSRDDCIKYSNLVLNSNVRMSIEVIDLKSSVNITIDLEGIECTEWASAVRRAVSLKYLFLVNDAINIPENVKIDAEALRQQLLETLSQEDKTNYTSKLADSVCSKLLFV